MNRKQLKKQAKGLIKTATPKPVLVTLVYVVILIAIAILSYKLVGQPFGEFFDRQFGDIFSVDFDIDYNDSIERYFESMDPDKFMDDWAASMPSGAARLLNLALELMTLVIGAGFIIFALRTIEGSGASIWNLFDGFGMFFRIIWLYILEGIFVFLWSLLFIIPGFIALYRYRMAIYLLLEHPELSALECINESKKLMKGHKWELFVLDLSFLGWVVLIAVVNGIGFDFGIALFTVVGLGYLVYLYFLPFRVLTCALYYKQLTAVPDINPENTWSPEL